MGVDARSRRTPRKGSPCAVLPCECSRRLISSRDSDRIQLRAVGLYGTDGSRRRRGYTSARMSLQGHVQRAASALDWSRWRCLMRARILRVGPVACSSGNEARRGLQRDALGDVGGRRSERDPALLRRGAPLARRSCKQTTSMCGAICRNMNRLGGDLQRSSSRDAMSATAGSHPRPCRSSRSSRLRRLPSFAGRFLRQSAPSARHPTRRSASSARGMAGHERSHANARRSGRHALRL